MSFNLRHLRVFLAVVDSGSVSKAADQQFLSQPAVTQALNKMERGLGQSLFDRTTRGLFVNPAGELLSRRVRRTFEFLDPVLTELSPRLKLTVTAAQLQCFIAVHETENFTLAARRLSLAQPTVHRAVSHMELEAGRALFERTSYGLVATRAAQNLAQSARLAFAELEQARADLAELKSIEVGRLVVGAMPLSRSYILPKAIVRFRDQGRKLPIEVVESAYDDLLAGLRRGEIDFLIGALRDPLPIDDIEQRLLFHDTVVLVAGPGHPLSKAGEIKVDDLRNYPWIVAHTGTPIRSQFDAIFHTQGLSVPEGIVESRSLVLMRELLNVSSYLGCISKLQAEAEIRHGLMVPLEHDLSHTTRAIGLTFRRGWIPTAAQAEFLNVLENVEPSVPTGS